MLEYGVSNGRKRIQVFIFYISPCIPVIFTTHDKMQHGDVKPDLLPATNNKEFKEARDITLLFVAAKSIRLSINFVSCHEMLHQVEAAL